MRKRRKPGDFDDEIEAHLTHEADRLIAAGLSPDQARATAARAFGNVTSARERFFEARPLRWLDGLRQDVRVGFRSLARYPVACAVAILSLGAGIGSTTTTLIVRDAVFYKPPPLYHAPGQLSHVRVGTPDHPQQLVPAALYRDWLAAPASGVELSAVLPPRTHEMKHGTSAMPVQVQAATSDLFKRLGVTPVMGRGLAPAASGDAATPALLPYPLWLREFGGRHTAVGETIWLDGHAHVIAGVLPPRFWFGTMTSSVWVPLDIARLPGGEGLEVIVRRSGSPAAAEAALQTAVVEHAARLADADRRLRVTTQTVSRSPLGHQVGYLVIVVLGMAVLLTLLIACTNVSVLVIAQWTAREHEIAIRTALGASRSRVVRTLLTESLLMAAIGGLLGVSATFALRGLIVRRLPGAGMFDLSVDAGLLAQVTGITLGVGVLAGLAPALYETRRLHESPLRAAASSDRVRQHWRHALVVFEITVTMALMVVTGAMLSAYRRALAPDPALMTSTLLSARIDQPDGLTIDRVRERLAAQPGVAGAAVAQPTPVLSRGPELTARADAAGSRSAQAERILASPELFTVLGLPLVTGRTFTQHDADGAPPVAVVNAVLAERLWPSQPAPGRELWIEGRRHEVVGVVAAHGSMLRPAHPAVYLPVAQSAADLTRVSFLLRTTSHASNHVVAMRRTLLELMPSGRAGVSTIDQVLAVGSQEVLASTVPLLPLIATGMVLTAAGIYGVLAFAVTRRSRELAIRVALGASRADILRLVAGQGFRLLLVGSVFGVGATFLLTRVAHGTGGVFDQPGWAAFVVPVVMLAAVGALATWNPVRRALRTDPATVLRTT